MPRISNEDLTPEQQAELESQKQTDQDANEKVDETKKPKTGRKPKTDEKTVETKTGPKPKSGGCQHEYVFHASQTYQDRPGKKFVYKRCVKCNDLKLEIENVKSK